MLELLLLVHVDGDETGATGLTTALDEAGIPDAARLPVPVLTRRLVALQLLYMKRQTEERRHLRRRQADRDRAAKVSRAGQR
jgi:hypothetical protein